MTKYGLNTQTTSSKVNSAFEQNSSANNSGNYSTNIVDNSSLPITSHKLNGHNFLRWSQSVLMYISGKGKDNYLTGEIHIPAETDAKYRTWKTENHMVMSIKQPRKFRMQHVRPTPASKMLSNFLKLKPGFMIHDKGIWQSLNISTPSHDTGSTLICLRFIPRNALMILLCTKRLLIKREHSNFSLVSTRT